MQELTSLSSSLSGWLGRFNSPLLPPCICTRTWTSLMSAALMVSRAATAALRAGMASARIASHSDFIPLAANADASA